MNAMRKILLPFFPESEFLWKHWWHRLALVVSIVTALILYTGMVFFIYLFISTQLLNSNSQHAYRLHDSGTGKIVEVTGSSMPTKNEAEEIFNTAGITNYTSIAIQEIKKPLHFDWFALEIAFILFILAWGFPNLLYRLALFIAFNDKWKKSKVIKT